MSSSNAVSMSAVSNKRTRKAAEKAESAAAKTKRVPRSRRKVQPVDETPVDNDAIESAMAEFNKRTPDQPKRGRKPVREDIYISGSLAKIDAMEGRLKAEKDTLTPKERDELRNKASALRSRVNRKLEHRTQLCKLDQFKETF